MKSVAVIGAGAAGLITMRALTRQDCFEVTAFDMSDRVGGTWVHNDKLKPSSMYDSLRVNIPKQIMEIPGFSFPEYEPNVSYVGHKDIQNYLDSFANHYNLKRHVQFRTKVMKVTAIVKRNGEEIWEVVSSCKGQESTNFFDAVIVCNGHFTVPVMPEITGTEQFQGRVMHSHFYRNPTPFKDETLLVLGVGPSGIDITLDIAPVAKKIYLSHNKDRLPCAMPDNVEEVIGLESLAGREAVLLDGSLVDVDTVIYATGYRYDFPFLTESCHPEVNNERVIAYKRMVDVNHPTLFYIGLNKSTTPFPQFHFQGEYASAVLRGVASLPNREAMIESIDAEYKEQVLDKGTHERFFAHLGDDQWAYNDDLAEESNVKPLHKYYATLYEHVEYLRDTQPMTFKDLEYRVEAPATFVTL